MRSCIPWIFSKLCPVQVEEQTKFRRSPAKTLDEEVWRVLQFFVVLVTSDEETGMNLDDGGIRSAVVADKI